MSGSGRAPTAGGPGEGLGARWAYGLLALALLGVFLASVRSVLSPFVLYLFALYVLWPGMEHASYRRLAAVATVAFALWVVEETGWLLAPFVLAGIFAYILDPAVDRLVGWRIPRSAAVGLLALPVLGLLALLVFVLAPAAVRQASEFVAGVPRHLDLAERWVEGVRAWILGLGIPGIDEASLPQLREVDADAVVRYLRGRGQAVAEGGLQAVLGIGRGVGALLTVVAYLVLLPVLTFYLLRDWDRILGRLRELLPAERRERVADFAARYDDLLSRYLRGQVLLSLIVGSVVWLGFTLVDFPYALLLGLLAAVFNLVPYLGFAVTLVASVILALFSGAVLASLGKVALVLLVEQVVEQVVGPLVVGESVGLHPVWVILALALFGFFFGFVGLLIAVPAAVFVKLVAQDWLDRYRGSAFYREGPAAAGEAEAAPPASAT